jgi:hypothetical protein
MLKVMKLLRRLRYLLRQREAEADLAEEIEFHRLMMGESRRSDLGNVTLAREDARAVWIWPWLESLWQDVAYAVRDLRRNPGFTTTALLVLGVAIGVNVSLFITFRTVVYQPWPVKEPEAVAQIMIRMPDGSLFGEAFRPIEYRLVAPHARSFSGLAHPLGESIRFGGAKYEIIGVA